MSFLTSVARQLLVASSPQLAGLSVGGLTGYPAVLLNQLKRNDSSIVLDLDSSSWIASIHGLAGIPSILIPTLMQWKGRRFAFIAACLSTLIGWTLTFFAKNVATILIGESFHGFGGNSLIAVSLITISEMVDPRFRSTSMILFGVIQMMGYVLVTFAGYFLHWRTVSIVMGVPTLLALLLVVVWPESPSWLACKGKFQKCEQSFIMLRGTGKDATKELAELLRAQKETFQEKSLQRSCNNSILRDVWLQVTRRDFFVPMMYLVLIMFTFYFSGALVIFTYAPDIISSTTNNLDFICFVYIDIVIMIASFLSIVLIKNFNTKPIMLASVFGSCIFSVLSSIVMYYKDSDVLPESTLLICLLGFIFFCVFGNAYLAFTMSAELIPVKHRGLGGALYIIVSCLFHSGSLKIAPYLFEYIKISGTFLVNAAVLLVGFILIRKYVPETKGKTLQEIEDFYNVKELQEIKFEMIVANDDFLE